MRASVLVQVSLLAIACGVLAVPLVAGVAMEERYECEIREAYKLTASGTLEAGASEGNPRNGRFVISRESGQVVGDWLTTLRASKSEVTQRGNGEWGFQTVARFANEGGESVQTIFVRHFAPGTEKPFVATSFGGIGLATGICKLK